ncbi:hypothetical protein ACTFIR_011862 [Dictyostelium discoideum]
MVTYCVTCFEYNSYVPDPYSIVNNSFICRVCGTTLVKCGVSGCSTFLLKFKFRNKCIPICNMHYNVYFPKKEDINEFHPDSLHEEIPFSCFDSDSDMDLEQDIYIERDSDSDSDTDPDSDSCFDYYKYSDPKAIKGSSRTHTNFDVKSINNYVPRNSIEEISKQDIISDYKINLIGDNYTNKEIEKLYASLLKKDYLTKEQREVGMYKLNIFKKILLEVEHEMDYSAYKSFKIN